MKRTLLVFLLVNLILSACAPASAPMPTPAPSATPLPTATATPTATTTCSENPPSEAQLYLKNPSFEETVPDKDHTLDPADWLVTEGKTRQGTHDVIEEMPELVQVVGAERQIRPCDGNKMLKIDARLTLKSSVIQYYPEPISTGRLIQELAVHPTPREYSSKSKFAAILILEKLKGGRFFTCAGRTKACSYAFAPEGRISKVNRDFTGSSHPCRTTAGVSSTSRWRRPSPRGIQRAGQFLSGN